MSFSVRTSTFACLTVLFAACGGEAPEADTAESVASPPAAAVTLDVEVRQEAEGGPAVVVATMAVEGLRIVPAGDTTSGTGHHHLYLDTPLAPAGQPVPSVPGAVIHLGDGSSSYTFDGVEPGEHEMIAVVADGVHVPLQPWVVDTVRFVVR